VAGEEGIEGAEIQELQILGALQRPGEVVGRDDGGEVEQGPRPCRGRDAVDGGRFLFAELAWAMDVDPGMPAGGPVGHGDIDQGAIAGPQTPQGGGVAVAEHGARTAGQDGGHPPGVQGEAPMTDRVHPAVQRMQAPTAHPQLDGALPEAQREQLGAADHPVLGLGEDRDRPVGTGWADFGLDVSPDSAHCLHDRVRPRDRADFGLVVIPNSAQSVHDRILTSRR